jgi:ABC-2 type transport system permease protein
VEGGVGGLVLANDLATYREKGILRRLATTPVPPARLLLAQLLVSLAATTAVVVVLVTVGAVTFGTVVPAQPLGFLLAFVLAAAALFAVGLLLAAVAPSGRVATGLGNLLFFPLNVLAGLWLPRAAMPEVLRRVGDFTPLAAAVQSLQDAAGGAWPRPLHLAVLAAVAAAAGMAAARLFRWE